MFDCVLTTPPMLTIENVDLHTKHQIYSDYYKFSSASECIMYFKYFRCFSNIYMDHSNFTNNLGYHIRTNS